MARALTPIDAAPEYRGENRYRRPFSALPAEKQIEVLLDVAGHRYRKRDRTARPETQRARRHVLRGALLTLRSRGMAPGSLLNFGRRHVQTLLHAWSDSGVSPSTIRSRISVLRWLVAALGKAGMVERPESYGVVLPPARPPARAFDPADAVIAAAAERDAWVALIARLRRGFGLSLQEAVRFVPFMAEVGLDSVQVLYGTRMKKSRVIAIVTEEQREVLQEAERYVTAHPGQSDLRRDGASLKESYRRYHYVMQRVGYSPRKARKSAQQIRNVPSATERGDAHD